MTLVSASTLLQQHLLAQGAPRAAARLARAPTPAPPVSPPLCSLDAPIHLCDTPASADALAQMLRRTLASANDTTLAFDAEWRPDGRGRCKSRPPSLLQLSTADGVWLVDLEAAAVVEHPERPLVLFAEVLRSESVRKLGFAVQGDLDRLQLRCSPRAGFAPGFALTARRVVDLREACNRTLPGAEPPCAGGLAAQLSRWAGVTLDKAPPCAAPLSPRHVLPRHTLSHTRPLSRFPSPAHPLFSTPRRLSTHPASPTHPPSSATRRRCSALTGSDGPSLASSCATPPPTPRASTSSTARWQTRAARWQTRAQTRAPHASSRRPLQHLWLLDMSWTAP